MKQETSIFIGSLGLDLQGFYPDDLPKEWQYDYYASKHRALMLPFDADVDFEEILEDIDKDFKLVIDISLIDDFESFIQPLTKFKGDFILYYNGTENEIIDKIKPYNSQDCMVVIKKDLQNELEIRKMLEKIDNSSGDVVVIFKVKDDTTLEKSRIISELLVF